MTSVSYRTCPLCEATCGLEVTLDGTAVTAVRGDSADVFSHGYICPKGIAIGELHHDPERLRRPLVRRADTHVEVDWAEAFAVVEERLPPLLGAHGRDAVAVYLGNPTVHNYAATVYLPALVRALGTGYRFTASTVDQMPKQVACGLLYGTSTSVTIPDIDRTDYLLILGANPMVSNGSLFTAPDLPGRLRALRQRGGRLVVVDPRRSRTAQVADEHLPIRPASDALWLAALAHTVIAEGLTDLGPAAPHVRGLEELAPVLAPFRPESIADSCGIPSATTRRIARELAAADAAAVYGRIGTTTTRFGTVASWLVEVLNILTGNLDRPGGVLWPKPAGGSATTTGTPGVGAGVRIPGARKTRVRGASSVFGEFPVACLAEEIDTPGPAGERIRGLVTVAGNPVLSTPNSARLDAALDTLEFMVSVDAYLNETTRHADVILPVPSPLARSHFDLVFTGLAIRNVAHYSAPSLPLEPGQLDEGEILLRLAAIAAGGGLDADGVDELVVRELARTASADVSSSVRGTPPEELLSCVVGRRREERVLDLMLRAGPYALTLDEVEARPHGLDLGALEPRLPEVLRTPSGRIELVPPQLLGELAALADSIEEPRDGLLLVGRRQLRSNNSWMHNLPLLAAGSNRCTLQVHPEDAERLALADGDRAMVSSRVGSLEAVVEVTDTVSIGVVSLPHGWGHGVPGTRMDVAANHAGVNANVLTDEIPLDPLSGTAVLNGIPVQLRAVHDEEGAQRTAPPEQLVASAER